MRADEMGTAAWEDYERRKAMSYEELEAHLRTFHPGPDAGYIGRPGPPQWLKELQDRAL